MEDTGAAPGPAFSGHDVFDPALATHPTRVVACDVLVDPLHVTNLPEVVDTYRAAMQRGDRFPPISVVRLFGIWFVADGHKRFTAYRTLGSPTILVEVWPLRRWAADHVAQARASVRRWSAVLRRRPGAPALGRQLRIEFAHLRRILRSALRRRRAGR